MLTLMLLNFSLTCRENINDMGVFAMLHMQLREGSGLRRSIKPVVTNFPTIFFFIVL